MNTWAPLSHPFNTIARGVVEGFSTISTMHSTLLIYCMYLITDVFFDGFNTVIVDVPGVVYRIHTYRIPIHNMI